MEPTVSIFNTFTDNKKAILTNMVSLTATACSTSSTINKSGLRTMHGKYYISNHEYMIITVKSILPFAYIRNNYLLTWRYFNLNRNNEHLLFVLFVCPNSNECGVVAFYTANETCPHDWFCFEWRNFLTHQTVTYSKCKYNIGSI